MNKQNITEKLVGEARKGSLWSPRSIVFYLLAIVYTLSPIDFIPDFIPVSLFNGSEITAPSGKF